MSIQQALLGRALLRRAWRASFPGLAAVAIFSVAINILKFATPLYLLQVLDRIPASRSVETLAMLTIVTVLAIAAGVALEAVRRRMLANWGRWIEQSFAPQLIRDAVDAKEGDREGLQSALDDVGRAGALARRCQHFFDVLLAPIFFAGLFYMHPVLGWIGVGSLALLLAFAAFREVATKEPRRSARDAAARTEEVVTSVAAARETAVAHGMGSVLAERWLRARQASDGLRADRESRAALFVAMVTGVGRLARIGIVAAGAYLLLNEQLTIGGMFASRVLAGFGLSLFERAVRDWTVLRDGVAGYRRTKARLLETAVAPAAFEGDVAQDPIVLDAVSFRHRGQRQDLYHRFSMRIEPGEVVAVTGAAATGKSTLSRLLVGLLEPRFGQIRLGDVVITRLPEAVRAKLIGYMPQHTELFRGTVRENIERLGAGPMELVAEAARLVDMHERIVRLPLGYDTVIGPDYEGLSGSERKRIALARAFYGWPRLVVLDEPAANLDRIARRSMEAAVSELKEHGSSVVVTQAIPSPRMNEIADRTLVLGENRWEGSAGEPRGRQGRQADRQLRSVT